MDDEGLTRQELLLEVRGLRQRLADTRRAHQTQVETLLTARHRAEAAGRELAEDLETERARLRAVLDLAPEAIAVADAQGRIILSNPKADLLYARTASPGKGSRPGADPCRSLLAGAALEGKSCRQTELSLWPEGDWREALAHAGPVRDRQGRITGAVAIFQDISPLQKIAREHRRLQEEAQNQAEELGVANEELQVQAEELQIQNEDLKTYTQILEAQKAELEAGRALLKSVLEQMPASVVVAAAPNGPILLDNPLADRIWDEPLQSIDDLEGFWRIPRYHPDGRRLRREEMPLWRSLNLGEHVMDEELILRSKQGGPIHLSVSSAPVRDAQGRVVAGVVTHFDITARKQAEAALRTSKAQLYTVFENLNEGLVFASLDGRLFNWNQAAVAMHGFASLEACSRYLPEFAEIFELTTLHGAVLPLEQWPLARIFRGEQLRDLELRVRRLDTDWQRILNYSGALARDPNGQPLLAVVSVTDITDRKLAEAALRRSEARFRSLVEANIIGFVVVNRENLLEANDAFLRMMGYSREDLRAGLNWNEMTPPEYRHLDERAHQEILTKGEYSPFEKELIRRDGKRVSILSGGTLLKAEPLQVVCLVLDITTRKQAETALRESQRDLNRAQAVARIGSWRLNVRRNELFWSDETYRIFGIAPGTPLTYESFLHAVHPDDREYVEQKWAAALRGEPYDLEHRIIAADSVKWVREKAELEFDPPGELVSGFGTAQDITQLKLAEEALRASEVRLRMAQQVAQIGTFEWNIQTGVNTWTPEMEAMYGLQPGDFARTQLAWENLVHPDDRDEAIRRVEIAFEIDAPMEGEWRVVWPNGSIHWLAGRWQVFKDESGKPLRMTGINMDITARKQAEAALHRAHEELEETVRERTAALRFANEHLRQEIQVRRQTEEALGYERERLFAVLERIPAHVSLLRADHTFAFVNGEFVRRFGEPGPKRCYELLEQENPCKECQAMAVFQTGKPVIWEWAGPDGKNYQIFDYPFIDLDGSPLALEMGVDITARKQAEEQAVSTGRMYRMLSQVNETIVRTHARDELFRHICRIMMAEGDFVLAWVGLLDPENRVVKAAAQFDLMDEYLQNIIIPLADVPEGHGPTGIAAREGRFDVCNDIASDPRMAPWRQEAMARGFRSSAAFPLRVASRVVGVLSVYAGRPEFFSQEEIALLESLAGNLSFALDFLDREAKRRQAEEALRESEERLRYLASQLLDAQERERHRLALELHDDLGQSLMVLKMQIRAIERMLPPEQWQTREQCAEALNYMIGIVDNVRRLSRDLRPAVLEDLGLPAALRLLLEEMQRYYNLELELDLDDQEGLLTRDEQVNIYRIFQESLTNIVKHARASRVRIAIKREAGGVSVRVEDNGVGFDLAAVLARDAARQGLGLAALEERVRMLGSKLTITSRENQGTSLAFFVPVTGVSSKQ
ncbi:MAG: PAS domain S-box protein [Syntrophobacterales bacterium]|jgi:PAS domain S-box-containing protein|nr:PAS domain S-box protein [Syntrophobacterales bacterium]